MYAASLLSKAEWPYRILEPTWIINREPAYFKDAHLLFRVLNPKDVVIRGFWCEKHGGMALGRDGMV